MTATRLLTAAAFLLAGCSPKIDTVPQGDTRPKATEAENHEHGAGPHGGAIGEWGKYHIEFTVDHPTKEATVYILDAGAKRPKPIAAKEVTLKLKLTPPVTVQLAAKPQKDDPEGKSSRFAGTHAVLGVEQEFEGTVSADVDGKTVTGDFKEEPEAPAPKK
jgi:hypothetical protein